MHPVIKIAFVGLSWAALIGATPAIDLFSPASFTVPLSGQQEVNLAHPEGGMGDPRASGSVRLSIDPAARQVCYRFDLADVGQPMMAHIHYGLPFRNGPPVVILFVGTGASLENCVASTRSQLTEIVTNPPNFYVSIDTTDFPDGALRGQL